MAFLTFHWPKYPDQISEWQNKSTMSIQKRVCYINLREDRRRISDLPLCDRVSKTLFQTVHTTHVGSDIHQADPSHSELFKKSTMVDFDSCLIKYHLQSDLPTQESFANIEKAKMESESDASAIAIQSQCKKKMKNKK